MSDLSPQSGPKRTLIRSGGVFASLPAVSAPLDANMMEGFDFGQAAGQSVDRAPVALACRHRPCRVVGRGGGSSLWAIPCNQRPRAPGRMRVAPIARRARASSVSASMGDAR